MLLNTHKTSVTRRFLGNYSKGSVLLFLCLLLSSSSQGVVGWSEMDTRLQTLRLSYTGIVVFNGELFMLKQDGILHSADGESWTQSWGPRSGLVGASLLLHEDRLFIIGGAGNRTGVYASNDGSVWTGGGSLPSHYEDLTSHASVTLGGVVWIFTGQYVDPYYYEPEGDDYGSAMLFLPSILKVENRDWQHPTEFPAPWARRTDSVGVAFAGKLWVIGGITASEEPIDFAEFIPLNDVWCSENGETWTEATANAPWCPRSGHACVVFQDKLWLLGGYNGHRALNDVWVSDDGVNWEQVTDQAPWRGRSGHSAVVYQDKLWVIAGANRNTNLSDVWTYDPAASEGEGEGEGQGEPQRYYHSADEDTDREVSLNELLRVIQFFNSDGLHCEPCTEDDYNPGAGDQGCRHHDSDYIPSDWRIDLNELLRLIQLYNMGGYHPCETGEDGFCPGLE